MRKTLLFAVVLLLISTFPTVCMAGWAEKEAQREVTFAGDIVVEEGSASLVVYEHKKLIIEWRPINLTFSYREGDYVWNDLGDLSLNWTIEYAGLPYDYFGRLYLKVDKRKGEATIIYRFGRVTEDAHSGLFRYHLEGTGAWSDADGTTCDEESFTIYELIWKGKKRPKATYDQRWTGLLTFNIEIESV